MQTIFCVDKICKDIVNCGYDHLINSDLYQVVEEYEEEHSLLPPPAYKIAL